MRRLEGDPSDAGNVHAIGDGLTGGAEAFAGLARPDTDFEAGVVFDPDELVRREKIERGFLNFDF